MKPIRILIIDDHSLFRSGIKQVFQRHKGFEVVGEASDGLEGVKRAIQLKPNVVLLDLHMSGISGLEALRLLKEDIPETQVVMLTVSEDAEDLLETLRAGARGYLLKNIDTEFLLESIQRAAHGESVMSPQIAQKLADYMRMPHKANVAVAEVNTGKLSPREREIIVMLARGSSNKEIARMLNLSESTIKIHVQGILRKLNLAKRVQAAVYAVEHGLIT
jgi:two-component system, NarL family, nitrate/nitrite response regulator NarL